MEKCVERIFFNEGKKTEEYGLKNIFWKKINEEDHTVSNRSGCYSLKTVMRFHRHPRQYVAVACCAMKTGCPLMGVCFQSLF